MHTLLRSRTIMLRMKVRHQGQSSPHTKALESGHLEDWEKSLGVGYSLDTLTPECLLSAGQMFTDMYSPPLHHS